MTAPLLPETIATPRLTLRPFRFEDVDEVLAYAGDEEWSKYLISVPHPYQRLDAVQFVARQVLFDRAVAPSWAVVIDGALVGSIHLRFKFDYLVAEMGWSLHRRLWGQGVVTEAVSAVIESAFRTHPRLTRIGATADTRNVASLRVMEKIGLQREGVLRNSRLSREGLVNEAIYGLLRSDWMRRDGRG